MDLGVDPEDLNACVQCGLCLAACPTYRVTGDETMSPRGRIALIREVHDADAPLTTEVVRALQTCVQCRGCEPACPSGVPYGRLIEQTRATLAGDPAMTPRRQRWALSILGHPRLLRAATSAIAVAQRCHLVPRSLGLPSLPLRRAPRPQPSGADVQLFTGCVMDAWQPDVHAATQRVLEAAGFGVIPTGDAAPCCGALHVHAGLLGTARRHARRVVEALRPGVPVVVNSAGCGAAMKDYGHLLGDPAAERFAASVADVSELLADNLDRLPPADPLPLRVGIQDPCHLRHVQRAHLPTRAVLGPYVAEVVELDDEGMCCGAGGAYSILEPVLARQIRDRKLASIARAGVDVVASANPGCALHLAAAGVRVEHPMVLVDRALRQARPTT